MGINVQQQSSLYKNAPGTFLRDVQNAVRVGEFSEDSSKFSV